jgi:hypothetical protein
MKSFTQMTAVGLNPDSRRFRIACLPPSGLSPPAAVADVISSSGDRRREERLLPVVERLQALVVADVRHSTMPH